MTLKKYNINKITCTVNSLGEVLEKCWNIANCEKNIGKLKISAKLVISLITRLACNI